MMSLGCSAPQAGELIDTEVLEASFLKAPDSVSVSASPLRCDENSAKTAQVTNFLSKIHLLMNFRRN
jgi:hypothetical protein